MGLNRHRTQVRWRFVWWVPGEGGASWDFARGGLGFAGDVDDCVGETRAQGLQSNPTHLKIVESQRSLDDVTAVPAMEEHPDHIPLTWTNKGRNLSLNFAKLFTVKQIVIPGGTRMMIELYEENDPAGPDAAHCLTVQPPPPDKPVAAVSLRRAFASDVL